MARILVTGASGMLGRVLVPELASHEVIGTALTRVRGGLTRLDLTNREGFSSLILDFEPAVIIHAAAERRPDVSQKDPEGTRRLNVDATRTLAQAARSVGAWVLYLSTDYVFDGTKPPYKPGDQTHPLNFYGETKLEGEQVLREVVPDAGILRVGVLYGRVEYWGESAVTAIHREATMDKDVEVDHWGQRYPTLVDDVAVICRQLAERRLSDGKVGGLWHWCGNERFTKYEMAKIMAELLGGSTTHLIADPNPPKGAPRPRDCELDCSALESEGLGRRTPFRTTMAEILRSSAGSAKAQS